MRLSVCIPAYNRAEELADLFDSIERQKNYQFELEVVVSDNASADDTQQVVERYKGRLPGLVYSRSAQNLGADRNFLRAVDLATGDFCWLMGSDDKFEDGAFSTIEHVLMQYPDTTGAIVAAQGYRRDLRTREPMPDPIADTFTQATLLEGVDNILVSIGISFGFLSSLIINKKRWDAVVGTHPVGDFYNSYIHVYVVANMVAENPRWLAVPARLVGYRGENDSFLDRGRFNRLRIDVVGYAQVFGSVLDRQGRSYRQIMSNVCRHHIFSHVMVAKIAGESRSYWQNAFPLLLGEYWRYPVFWKKVLPVMLAPPAMFRTARRLVRAARRGRTVMRAFP